MTRQAILCSFAIVITLKDVAQKAGVSHTTVWMALRNHPRISVPTRDKILKLAQQMGYHSNPLISAHMANVRKRKVGSNSTTLALVSSETEAHFRKQPHRLFWHQGVRGRAEELGYNFDHFCINTAQISPSRMERILLARGISGVVWGILDQDLVIDWDWDRFACVILGRKESRLPPFGISKADDADMLQKSWERARAFGYRRISFIIDELSDHCRDYKMRACYLSLQTLIPKQERIPLIPSATGTRWNAGEIAKWLDRHQPDCVLSYNPEVYDWIQATGRSIPEDIAYVGVSTPHKKFCAQARSNYTHLTRQAVDMLDSMLLRNERGIPQEQVIMLTSTYWRDGKTLPSRN